MLGAGPDNSKFKVNKKTGQITTAMDLDYDAVTDDQENNCRDADFCTITITATDASGDDVAAEAEVTIKVTDVDEKPTFVTADPDAAANLRAIKAIKVEEGNTALAADADADDVTYEANDPEGRSLAYRLMGTDGAMFKLDASYVLSFKAEPDYEKPTDRNKDNVYEVTVRASAGTLYADRMVKVTVTGVDDAPEIMGKDSVSHKENDKGTVATFTGEDPEGVTPITWGVLAVDDATGTGGVPGDSDAADAADFEIDKDDGMLKFSIGEDGNPPDFENPMGSNAANNCDVTATPNPCKNTYKVVVTASDGSVTGYHKVTVEVTNEDEEGEVTWDTAADGSTEDDRSPLTQFAVGALLTASVEDGDVAGVDKTDVVNPTWRWKRGSSVIPNETSATYTVTTSDVGKRIRVEVAYNVGDSTNRENAYLTSDHTVLAVRAGANKLKFEPAEVDRKVAEGKNGANVGAPVTATGNHGAVNYALGDAGAGPDNSKFKVNKKTGQITTAMDLDYDAVTDDQENNCRDADFCTITITATDASGDDVAAEAEVTIKVTDVDEKPTFVTADPNAAANLRAIKAIKVEEGNTALAADADADDVTYEATDPEDLNVNLTLMGTDGAMFSLSSGDVLSFKAEPDYEKPTDRNKDNVYEVTVRASDGTLNADRMVKVTVTGADEPPEIMMVPATGVRISGDSRASVDEGDTAVETYTASGLNAASARWTLEGADAGDFSLSTSRGASTMLRFRSAPDYEAPADADTNNVYMVTLKATVAGEMDTHAVTVTVTDVVEDVPVIGDTLLDRHIGNDGTVSKTEVIAAFREYVTADGSIVKSEIIDVYRQYIRDNA